MQWYQLAEADYLSVLETEPENAEIYKKLFELDDVELDFDEDALNEVAKIAMERKTGARGLRSVMEKTMTDVMFDAPSDSSMQKCIITKDAVTGKSAPVIVHGEKKIPKRRSSVKRQGRPETA